MFSLRHVIIGFVLLASAGASNAQARQFYSRYWQKEGGYYYRNYYYKVTPNAATYRYHRVVYYPSQPRYYYYYNPYSGKYWGRFDCSSRGYSRLAEKEQRERILDIPEKAFPEPGPMPTLPEASDNIAMLPPREELGGVNAVAKDLPIDETKEIARETMSHMTGLADAKLPRQVFSSWCKEGPYYFRCCYYQPVAGGVYKSHRVIYYPSRPRYVYYYNPYKAVYWGRFDLEGKDDRVYSLLRDEDRRSKLSDIRADAFPMPAAMPWIPDATDEVRLVAPPRDLPE